jgi:hypothetical protein
MQLDSGHQRTVANQCRAVAELRNAAFGCRVAGRDPLTQRDKEGARRWKWIVRVAAIGTRTGGGGRAVTTGVLRSCKQE